MTATAVFLWALGTALATGLGALPFLFMRHMSRRWLGISNAIAAGLMVGASIGLLQEGLGYGLPRLAAGAALGVAFLLVSHRALSARPNLTFHHLRGADARRALMIVAVMTIHSVSEGVGVGVAFGGGEALGLFITIAIAVHNIPEGLAISLVLVPRGESVPRAAGWSVVSSLPQPLLAVPSFLFVETFTGYLPVGLGFAAGAMIWMVLAELLPEAIADAGPILALTTLAVAIVAMLVFQAILHG